MIDGDEEDLHDELLSNLKCKMKKLKPQLGEKERHFSYCDIVQQWFCILTWLFLISFPSPL